MTRGQLLSVGLWFSAVNVLLAIGVSWRFAKYINLGGNLFDWMYMAVASAGHYGMLSLLLFLLLLVPATLVLPRRNVLAAVAILIMSAAQCVLVIDTFVFDLFRFHINIFVIEMIFGTGASQIFVFDALLYLKAALFISLIVAVEFISFIVVCRLSARRKLVRSWVVWASVLACVVVFNLTHAWASAYYYRPIVQASRFYPLFYPLTANSFLYKHGIVDASHARERLATNSTDNQDLCYPLHPITGNADGKTYNILFVLIDSWNHRTCCSESSPNISAFAGSSLVFRNHYSGSNGTRGGIFTLFYSLPALYWYDVEALQLSPVLISQLEKRGYDIKTFASASLKNPPFERTVFRSLRNLRLETPGATAHERDCRLTDDWIHYADSVSTSPGSKPFFGFLFYDLPHAYDLPKDYKKHFSPAWDYADYMSLDNNTDPTEFFNLYRSCVYYDDSLVGRILDNLKKNHLQENTIVIITGDHGQEFNENHKNFWGHNGNFTRAQVGVPLIVYWPGRKHQQYWHMTTHYDVVPTLLHDVFAVENPSSDFSVGTGLLDTTARPWHVMGSKENFAIMYGGRLVTVDYNSSFEVTDTSLNQVPDKLDTRLVNTVLKTVNAFYKKR